METHLQETAGLRRTAPVQSPVPVGAGARLSAFQRTLVGFFVAVLALSYLAALLPAPEVEAEAEGPAPVSPRS